MLELATAAGVLVLSPVLRRILCWLRDAQFPPSHAHTNSSLIGTCSFAPVIICTGSACTNWNKKSAIEFVAPFAISIKKIIQLKCALVENDQFPSSRHTLTAAVVKYQDQECFRRKFLARLRPLLMACVCVEHASHIIRRNNFAHYKHYTKSRFQPIKPHFHPPAAFTQRGKCSRSNIFIS